MDVHSHGEAAPELEQGTDAWGALHRTAIDWGPYDTTLYDATMAYGDGRGLHFERLEGALPLQGWGHHGEDPFYLRLRHGAATLTVWPDQGLPLETYPHYGLAPKLEADIDFGDAFQGDIYDDQEGRDLIDELLKNLQQVEPGEPQAKRLVPAEAVAALLTQRGKVMLTASEEPSWSLVTFREGSALVTAHWSLEDPEETPKVLLDAMPLGSGAHASVRREVELPGKALPTAEVVVNAVAEGVRLLAHPSISEDSEGDAGTSSRRSHTSLGQSCARAVAQALGGFPSPEE